MLFTTMHRYFHSELDALKSKLILMGERSIEAVGLAMDGLIESDMDTVERALALDDAIDKLELLIDHESVRYVTLRAPVSADVRLIVVAIKAGHDLERVGDEAHTIAKKTRSILTRDGRTRPLPMLREMRVLTLAMMSDALACFIDEDAVQAASIIARDKEVDELNRTIIKTLAEEIQSDPSLAATAIDLIFVSKSLERIADHAKNLAEEVIYLLTPGNTADKNKRSTRGR